MHFGDVGENRFTLASCFERQCAPSCPPQANPAECTYSSLSCLDLCAAIHLVLGTVRDIGAAPGLSIVHHSDFAEALSSPLSRRILRTSPRGQ